MHMCGNSAISLRDSLRARRDSVGGEHRMHAWGKLSDVHNADAMYALEPEIPYNKRSSDTLIIKCIGWSLDCMTDGSVIVDSEYQELEGRIPCPQPRPPLSQRNNIARTRWPKQCLHACGLSLCGKNPGHAIQNQHQNTTGFLV